LKKLNSKKAAGREFWATLLATILVCACSSVSTKQTLEPFPLPPAKSLLKAGQNAPARLDTDAVGIDHDLEQNLRDNPSDSMRFLVRYRQAKLWSLLDPAKACALWIEVSNNNHFPLVKLARLHAVETCPLTRQEITPWLGVLTSSDQEPWLKELTQHAALARAVKASDKKAEMQYRIEMAASEHQQAAQLALLDRALTLAKEQNDQRTEESVRALMQKVAPRLIVDPKPPEYMSVASDYRRARGFDNARSFYQKVFESTDTTDIEKLKALDGIRMTYKLDGQREKFLKSTHQYSDFAREKFFPKNAKLLRKTQKLSKYVETRILLARTIWTENSPQGALQVLTALERELKGRFPVDESMFLRARIAEEGGHLDEAIKILSQIDDTRIADRGLRSKILWYRAWTLRKATRFTEAGELLTRLTNDDDSTSLIARDRYWLGRTLKDAGAPDKAKDEFQWLIANDPVGYYGTLAYRELGTPLSALVEAKKLRMPAQSTTAPVTTSLESQERLVFEWLLATEEADLARRFLDQVPAMRRSLMSDDQTLDFLQQYARAGAYQTLFSRLGDLSAETRKQILDKQPELIFPRPWAGLVQAAAEKSKIQIELIYSIMRQESSFNPNARSGADAFGLMQLIPEVAQHASSGAGLELKSHEDLYRPETNIPLGAEFVRELLAKWDGRFIPAVASYNASEKAVAGWLHTRDRHDPLAFIEDIPYEETKGYVKLVLRNFVFYSRLNSGGQPIAFPEWCLAGIQDVKP
jgi:soluble lytic murein transglycosylase